MQLYMFKFGDMKGVETKEKMADWKSTPIIVQHFENYTAKYNEAWYL